MGTIDFKTKFDELFGEESAYESAPTLQDVAPGLVDTGSARFVSKELNPRRTSVSARHLRSPRVRSAEGTSMAPSIQTSVPLPEAQSGFEAAPPESEHPLAVAMEDGGANPGFGSSSFRIGESGESAGGELGTTIGNEMAAQLGTMGGLGMIGAIPTAMAAHSLGATSGQLATGMIGTGVMSALSPAILANVVGGGLVAGQMAYGLGEEAPDPVTGATNTPAVNAAFNAASSKGGAVGMGINSLIGKSPSRAAELAFSNAELADPQMAFNYAQHQAKSEQLPNVMSLGPQDTSMMTNPAGLQSDFEGITSNVEAAAPGADNIGSVEGAAGKGGNIMGLFASGAQAEQGAPVGIGGTIGQSATGWGGSGGVAGSVGTGNQGAVGMGAPTGETGEGFGGGGGGGK